MTRIKASGVCGVRNQVQNKQYRAQHWSVRRAGGNLAVWGCFRNEGVGNLHIQWYHYIQYKTCAREQNSPQYVPPNSWVRIISSYSRGSDSCPIFPEEKNQCLICAKPWTLNPSQTLINALDVGPHRGCVTLLRPDPCPVSDKGIFSSPSLLILFHLLFNHCL